jgi:probable HAF family extracellular repeat protein
MPSCRRFTFHSEAPKPAEITRRRSTGLEMQAAVAVLCFVSVQAHALRYEAQELGGMGQSINNAGVVVGGTPRVNGVSHTFRYVDGRLEDLGTFGEQRSIAHSINSAGDIAGDLGPALYGNRAFVYSMGSVRSLTSESEGGWSSGYAITDSGHVLVNTVEPLVGKSHVSVYALNGSKELIDTLEGMNASATGMNASGQICGFFVSSAIGEHGFLYEHGAWRDLGSLGGSTTAAAAINVNGTVVGSSEVRPRSGVMHAFMFGNKRMRDLGTLGGSNSVALSINAFGGVVGRSESASGKDTAFLYEHGRMVDLNALLIVPLPRHIHLWRAVAINDVGQIVADGHEVSKGSTINHGYLLSPK